MVLKVVLQIQASGENVKSIKPSENFIWNVKLTSRDPTCSKTTKNDETPTQTTKTFIKIDQTKWVKSKVDGKSAEMVNHNQVFAFEDASVAVIEERLGVYEFDESLDSESSDAGSVSGGVNPQVYGGLSGNSRWQTICVFRCDNCDVTDFKMESGSWKVESSNGTVFEDCEVEEGEWYDVDSGDDLVSVTGMKWRFSKKSVGFEDESKYLVHYIENCLHIADHHNRDE